jgi:hypothetical protein
VCSTSAGVICIIITFTADGPTVSDILVHLGKPTTPPRIAPARDTPVWEATSDAQDHDEALFISFSAFPRFPVAAITLEQLDGHCAGF